MGSLPRLSGSQSVGSAGSGWRPRSRHQRVKTPQSAWEARSVTATRRPLRGELRDPGGLDVALDVRRQPRLLASHDARLEREGIVDDPLLQVRGAHGQPALARAARQVAAAGQRWICSAASTRRS